MMKMLKGSTLCTIAEGKEKLDMKCVHMQLAQVDDFTIISGRVDILSCSLRDRVHRISPVVSPIFFSERAAKEAAREAEDEAAKLKCPVCEAIKACGHVFCSSCIDKAMNEKGKKCPTCRARTKKKHVLKLYL
ncbi:hypothetical protein DCAR_0625328 [Daucus carota subsp. sativus]|uniref:RING-type domain-containing protein n=1 Tax=Daucus carota subsp. sativus TaxID=79200 RepID=A0AAF0XDP0_DAUCS|nr:hypothetical protein DCAR_0625328 [Daucus carota subsp. sativus]